MCTGRMQSPKLAATLLPRADPRAAGWVPAPGQPFPALPFPTFLQLSSPQQEMGRSRLSPAPLVAELRPISTCRTKAPGEVTTTGRAMLGAGTACSQSSIRPGQAPAFGGLRASRVISRGREGWSQTCSLSSGPASVLLLSHPIRAGKPQHLNPTAHGDRRPHAAPGVSAQPVPRSCCRGQRDGALGEGNRADKAAGKVSAPVPLSCDSPQDRSHHP